MIKIGIVLGGAESVWDEYALALRLCYGGEKPVTFACNDMIAEFPRECVGVTLHHYKVPGWLNQRQERRYGAPSEVWHYDLRESFGITNAFGVSWGGSVGLDACRVAFLWGCDKVMLCGVPMDTHGGHFLRRRYWPACDAFRDKWLPHRAQLLGRVRSFSGWTCAFLGGQPPDVGWLGWNTLSIEPHSTAEGSSSRTVEEAK